MLGDDSNFLMFARPEGERCLVMSGKGTTIARGPTGFVTAKFASGLPGGAGLASHIIEQKEMIDDEAEQVDDDRRMQSDEADNLQHRPQFSDSDICVLDCIFNKQVKTYFIVDLLQWQDVSYREFPLSVRLHCLNEKIAEIRPKLTDYPKCNFQLVEYMPCTVDAFNKCYYGPVLQQYLISRPDGTATPEVNQVLTDLNDSLSTLSKCF